MVARALCLRQRLTVRIRAGEIGEGIEMCRAECKYFPVCGGGVPSNKVFENGTFASTETMYCRLTKKRVTDFLPPMGIDDGALPPGPRCCACAV